MEKQNYPYAQMGQNDEGQQESEFINPLCGCTKNCGFCLCSAFCPWYLLYKNAQAVSIATKGKRSCFMACCIEMCGFGCFNRLALREAYHIKGSLCSDCLTRIFCGFCALTQHHYEVEDREYKE